MFNIISNHLIAFKDDLALDKFAYWLQGFFEVSETDTITDKQAKLIKAHLNLVFKHEIDPSNLEGKSKEGKEDYSKIHSGDYFALHTPLNC
jgi:hypothetical protein